MTLPAAAKDVLEFWFGDAAGGDEAALQDAFSRWFGGGDAFDTEIEERFGVHIETALSGGLVDWESDVRSRLALVILLDQFPRNVFRRTAKAFAGDDRAIQLARDAVREGLDEKLLPVEQVFLLMPYQHAEDISLQEEGVRLFRLLADGTEPHSVKKLLQSSFKYAQKHCDIIARFGRFPYRNAVLGRRSTPDEERWLQDSGERFGQ
ncbi:MAG: DUF924 domain-containing protein [Proteobacteria bacterium]|nr:DUF924 domain-containing protein [Pseudomonadota bacterium]